MDCKACIQDADAHITGLYSHVRFQLKSLHDAFSEGYVKGSRCIELGCGTGMPKFLISATRVCDEVVASDSDQRNIGVVKKWLLDKSGETDWTPHFKYVADLEGHKNLDIGAAEIESRLRNVLDPDDVILSDVTKEYPLKEKREDFDVVIINCSALECSTVTPDAYVQSLKNIGNILKPGGKFVFIGYLGCTWYILRNVRLPKYFLTKEFLLKSLSDANFDLRLYKDLPMQGVHPASSDCKMAFFSVSTKK